MVDDRPQGMGPDDVDAIGAMATVYVAATGDGRAQPRPAPADVDGLTAWAITSVHSARGALDGLQVLGPTRFRFAKRVLLRAARLVTHQLIHADRALADAVEALAVAQRDQAASIQRMSDSVRALVVSADLSMGDAVERVLGVDEHTGAAQDPTLEPRVVLLEARLAELEQARATEGGA